MYTRAVIRLKRQILKCVALGCATMLWCNAAQAEAPIRVAVFGDSLTSGYQLRPNESYAGLLDRKLKQNGYTNVEVLNMSIPNETTADAVERLPQVRAKRPDIAIIAFGANDVLRGINTGVIYNNIAKIIGHLSQDGAYIILMGIKPPASMGSSYASQLEASFKQLAETYKIALYPSLLNGIAENPELNLADGFHPNAKGMEVIVSQTYNIVDQAVRWKWNTVRYQQQYEQYRRETGGPGANPNDQTWEAREQLNLAPPPAIIEIDD